MRYSHSTHGVEQYDALLSTCAPAKQVCRVFTLLFAGHVRNTCAVRAPLQCLRNDARAAETPTCNNALPYQALLQFRALLIRRCRGARVREHLHLRVCLLAYYYSICSVLSQLLLLIIPLSLCSSESMPSCAICWA
jgi:hypothetical protein